MKEIFLTLLVTITITTIQAQNKIKFVDVEKIFEQAEEYEKENELEKALDEISKVPENDSSYLQSLVARTYYLINTEQYDEAIELTEIGMKAENIKTKYYFYLNNAAAYLDKEDFETALTKYNEALKRYPKSYKLTYSKAIALEKLERFEEASEMYQQAIILNPFNKNAHLKLGLLAYQEHHITQAMMCLSMYLIINPDGPRSLDVLSFYNEIVKSKNEEEKHNDVSLSADDEAFEEIDLIINNYAALNKKYKTGNKINLAVVKQNHAMIQQLKKFEGNGGFWDKYYVPFFLWIDESKQFNNYVYTFVYSNENKKYKALCNKNISGIKDFLGKSRGKWSDIIGNQEEEINGSTQKVTYFYDNNKLSAIGNFTEDKPIGLWRFYSEYGYLSAKGKFNNNGEKEGFWQWFNEEGGISEEGEYEDGKINGTYKVYHPNGQLQMIAQFVDGKRDGTATYYNKYGAEKELIHYKEGEFHGEYTTYHAMGKGFTEYTANYVDNEIDGEFVEYYTDGIVRAKLTFKEGKKEGKGEIYYHDGQLDVVKNYLNDELHGDFKEYHYNGQIYKEGKYVEDKAEGIWKTYYSNGQLESEKNYVKGKINGIVKEYDRDGKLHNEFTYKKGIIIAYKFYDKKGNVIKEAKKKAGEFFYEGHAPNGNITSEGLYDIDGGKEGEWKYYSSNHVLENIENYKEGEINGEAKSFYNSGILYAVTNYEDGLKEGYAVTYYQNEQMRSQGYYKKDEKEGEWRYYYKDGTLQSIEYYNSGKLYGYVEYYAVDGKLVEENLYYNDELLEEFFFDEDKKIVEQIKLDIDSSEYTITNRYRNGNISVQFKVVKEYRHGKYISNYFSGKRYAEGDYFHGKLNGEWVWYHENGKVKTKGKYIHGNKVGEWVDYFENGKVEKKQTYEAGLKVGKELTYNEKGILTQSRDFLSDQLHGEVQFYSEDGQLQVVRHYQFDRLIGYSYLGKDGKRIEMIPIENETAKIVGYFKNGKVGREFEMKNGDFVGPYKEYYSTGQLFEMQHYLNDERHGEHKIFYPNGQVKVESNYQYGEINGVYKSYHPNGKVKEEITYLNDTRHGEAKFYNSAGKLIKVKVYVDGEVISETKM